MHAISQAREDPGAASLRIRRARAEDVPLVSALDAEVTGLAKPDYWRDVFERYGERRLDERFFLIAEIFGQDRRDPILGFIVGEVRAWEFGSQPCGWVFAFSVEPEARLKGVGTSLFDAIAAEFKHAGVDRMRTMVARDNHLHMTFFRSEGMMAGPYIQLEKDLD
jgi:ribosomal protein S18 acetylase RimI-like enzyme